MAGEVRAAAAVGVDALFDLVTEVPDQALHGPGGGVAEGADGVTFDLTGHVESVDDLTPRERDDATLTELYERYGFRTWLRDLTGDAERVPTGDARIAVEAPAAEPVAGH